MQNVENSKKKLMQLGMFENDIIPEKLQYLTAHMREIGRDMLKLRLDEKAEMEKEHLEIVKQSARAGKLLRRKIKVTDMVDGGASVTMDQEWDTSGWSTDMIEAGCSAIILLFQEIDSIGDLKKQRALQMLDKLIYRHDQAHVYVKNSMESLVNKCCNRLIRGGRAASMLDLLYVLHCLRVKYLTDLSSYNFVGKFFDMCIVESKLACILIQHTFRCFRDRNRKRPMESAIAAGFGSDSEIRMLRLRAVNGRSQEIRRQWRVVHWHMTETHRAMCGGVRGPAHIRPHHIILGLETTLHLVGAEAGSNAPPNREDVVYSHGIIMLSTYLACCSGPFSELANKILCWVSKSPESVLSMLQSGVVQSLERYFKYLFQLSENQINNSNNKIGSPNRAIVLARDHDDEYNDNEHLHRYYFKSYVRKRVPDEIKKLYLNCLNTVERLGCHCAGIYRCWNDMPCKKVKVLSSDTEELDYSNICKEFGAKLTKKVIVENLGRKDTIEEVIIMMLNTDDIEILEGCLRVLFALSCGDCYDMVVELILSNAGTTFFFLYELIEHPAVTVSSLVLAFLLQLCTKPSGRAGMIATRVDEAIADIITPISGQYERLPYNRGIYLVAAYCRQYTIHPYEPEYFVEKILDVKQVRRMFFLDMLKTIKVVDINNIPALEKISLRELILIPFHSDRVLDNVSKCALSIKSARHLSDYLSHPGEPSYFESLPWEESVASCQILQALSQSPETALCLFNEGLIHFLGQCLYVAKYAFLGKSVSDSIVKLVLSGVTAAATALSHLCKSACHHQYHANIIINGFKHSNLIGAGAFFIPGLNAANSLIKDIDLKYRQESVGFSVVMMMDEYASMLLTLNELDDKAGQTLGVNSTPPRPKKKGKKSGSSVNNINAPADTERFVCSCMSDLDPVARQVVALIGTIRSTYGDGDETYHLLDIFCNLLVKITTPIPLAGAAVLKWSLFDALAKHLPPPLASVGTVATVTGSEVVSTIRSQSAQSLTRCHTSSSLPAVAKPGGTMRGISGTYQATLGAIPSSYFNLIANLCQSAQGIAIAFGNSMLRRSLEKCVVSKDLYILRSFDHLDERSVEEKEWEDNFDVNAKESRKLGKYLNSSVGEKSREDMAATLNIFMRCANYNNMKLGNSNDLILLDQYHVIPICCEVLSSPDCPRNDAIFVNALSCIAAFSQDGIRVHERFSACDVPSILLEELSRTKEFMYNPSSNCLSAKYLLMCLSIIRHIAVSMSMDPSIRSFFPLYREHVMRVMRIYPQHTEFIEGTLWCMAKACMSAEGPAVNFQTTAGSGGMEQLEQEIKSLQASQIQIDNPENFHQSSRPALGSTKSKNNASMLERTAVNFTMGAISKQPIKNDNSFLPKIRAGSLTMKVLPIEETFEPPPPSPGTYRFVGVSSRGGLKNNL